MIENLKESIEKMEQILSEMKEEYKKEAEREYRTSGHKSFNVGDWICKNKDWGKVGWTENKCCNLPEEAGYVGIDLYSGSRGFLTCKRDNWSLMSEEDLLYLTKTYKVRLTGEEIQEVLSMFSRCCTSLLGDKIREKLKSIGEFSFNKK